MNGKTLVLARSDLWKNPCPTTFLNSTLDSNYFDADGVENVDLTIFFGCSSSLMPIQPQHRFFCDVGGVDLTDSYFLIGNVPIEPILKMIHCFKGVRTPLLRTVADDLNQSMLTLAEALTMGFQVTYSNPFDEKCLECGRLQGLCGFNVATSQPICICNSSICNPPGVRHNAFSYYITQNQLLQYMLITFVIFPKWDISIFYGFYLLSNYFDRMIWKLIFS